MEIVSLCCHVFSVENMILCAAFQSFRFKSILNIERKLLLVIHAWQRSLSTSWPSAIHFWSKGKDKTSVSSVFHFLIILSSFFAHGGKNFESWASFRAHWPETPILAGLMLPLLHWVLWPFAWSPFSLKKNHWIHREPELCGVSHLILLLLPSASPSKKKKVSDKRKQGFDRLCEMPFH